MFSNRTTGRVSSAAAAFIAAAVLVAGATAPAYAAAPDPTTDTPKASAKAGGKERRYCVKPQTSTGTIFNGKTCLTREQWIAKTGVDPATASAQK